jgi:predicted O-linked N-acetylglucosamine transferase (SPINDLY family)
MTRYEEAKESYLSAIKLKLIDQKSLFNLGVTLQELNNHEEAIEYFNKVIGLNSLHSEAHYSKGLSLQRLKKWHDAIASYDIAISINIGHSQAYNNRGMALKELKKLNEALLSLNKSIELSGSNPEAHNSKGLILFELRHFDAAVKEYDIAISIDHYFTEAHNNRGNAFKLQRKYDLALADYDKAIQLDANFSDAHFNKGDALHHAKKFDKAILSFDNAIKINPNDAEAYFKRGIILNQQKLFSGLDNYRKALSINAQLPWLNGAILHSNMVNCVWDDFIDKTMELERKIKSGEKASFNFYVLGLTESAELQMKASETWSTEFPINNSLGPIKSHPAKAKIRLGYFSADFYSHATCVLMAELFEKHDKSKFELFAFSFGPNIKDPMRTRVEAAFDQFIDVSTMSDKEIAEFSRMLGIDIAIDLKGSTKDHRFGIFSYRAAPVQVSYLGYPGTMGAEYIDYLIADKTLIPEESQKFYTEKIAYMPHSYQVNDRSRVISDRVFTKKEVGLLEKGFVFACFNSNYKITPDVFDVWARILNSVEGSVLWLFEENKTASANLRKEAQKRGLAPERLVFAPKMELSEHLARHKLADLFIDTLPCNAHTTASDALWAGLPVLTCMGESFASRVAASLLNAIEMPELITSSLEEYEQLAIALGNEPQKVQALKQKLELNKLTTPLFDSSLFTKNLEYLFWNILR